MRQLITLLLILIAFTHFPAWAGWGGGNNAGGGSADGIFLNFGHNGAAPTIAPFAPGPDAACMGSGCVAGGDNAAAAGKSNAGGNDSFAAAIGDNASNKGAQATGAVAIGNGNYTSNLYGWTLGQNNTSSGSGAGSAGFSNTSTGTYSYILGNQSTNSGNRSVMLGFQGAGLLPNALGFAGGAISTAGDNQWAKFIYHGFSTDATPKALFTDGTATRGTLSNNSTWACTCDTVARRASTNEASWWHTTFLITRGATAATTAIIGVGPTQTLVYQDAGAAGWGGPAYSANTTAGAIELTWTGAAASNIRIMGMCDALQMVY